MKKFLVLFAAVAILAFSAMAFAQGGGYGCRGGGSGYGGGGPGFMWRLAETEEGKKFLEDTQKLRKKMHDLRYEIKEAWIADDEKKAEKLETKAQKLRDEIREKAEKAGIDNNRGYGKRGGRGYGRGYGDRHGYMWGLDETKEGKKFLEETKELRKKKYLLKYEVKEAWLADDEKKAEKLEAELNKLRDEFREKADKAGIETKRGYGKHGGRGYGRGFGGGYGCNGGGPANCDGPGSYDK